LDLSSLINKLKNKKELKGLSEDFIRSRALEYLKKNKVDLNNEKNKDYRLMFKVLRKKLREVYGAFRSIKEKRELEFYKKIFYEFKPKTVLDLGCGLEPLDYAKIYNAEYYCLDINKEEIKRINEFFKQDNISGKAFVFNLVDENLGKLPNVDLCLILKALESLEAVKKNFSRELLSKIKSKVIIASFSKIALGKKARIKKAGRSWLRKILKKLNYNYEIRDYKDEIMFIIKKPIKIAIKTK